MKKDKEKIKAFVIEPDVLITKENMVNVTVVMEGGGWECEQTSLKDVIERADKENVPIIARKYLETKLFNQLKDEK